MSFALPVLRCAYHLFERLWRPVQLIGMLCRQLLDRTPAVCGAERTGKPFECCISTGLCRKSAEQFVLIHSRPVLSHKKLFHDSICRREEKCVHRGINCG